MRVDDLRSLSIFDGLTDDQLADLIMGGTEVRIEPGVDLFREGEYADFWWVLIEGAIDLIRHVGREATVVARMDVPGRWAGGFRAWDEHGTYLATGRGASYGRVLRVPAEVLRERASDWFPFGAHLIAGLYRTARSIESTARQRSSLVTLGTLAAGIAHDAFHAKLYHDYLKQHPDHALVPDDVWTGEAAERRCLRHQTRVLKDIGASFEEIRWSREINHRYWEVEYHKRDW